MRVFTKDLFMSDTLRRLCEKVDRNDLGAWWSLRMILKVLNERGADIRPPEGETRWNKITLCRALDKHFATHPDQVQAIIFATHPQVVDKDEAYDEGEAVGEYKDPYADEYRRRQLEDRVAYRGGRDDEDRYNAYTPMSESPWYREYLRSKSSK